ncbi:LysR family transcriptional regulator [Streptomyces sp. NPDC127197]|uniref:LysR family transcriptional regulator n=1 Tax=Streptomyces sp. NPDC127197 TaxID=3345388 RepID=UPI003638C313
MNLLRTFLAVYRSGSFTAAAPLLGLSQPTVTAQIRTPNLHAVVAAGAAGAGYSVLPQSLCEEHLAAGRLALLHDPQEPPLNTLFLVQRPGAGANPDVIRVRDRLRSAARAW